MKREVSTKNGTIYIEIKNENDVELTISSGGDKMITYLDIVQINELIDALTEIEDEL